MSALSSLNSDNTLQRSKPAGLLRPPHPAPRGAAARMALPLGPTPRETSARLVLPSPADCARVIRAVHALPATCPVTVVVWEQFEIREPGSTDGASFVRVDAVILYMYFPDPLRREKFAWGAWAIEFFEFVRCERRARVLPRLSAN